jgi:hypothetical protein
MSTIAEIEAAIERLRPEDFRALQDWMAKRSADTVGRQWTPEELSSGAKQMVEEPDPARADAIWERTVAGFYGNAFVARFQAPLRGAWAFFIGSGGVTAG